MLINAFTNFNLILKWWKEWDVLLLQYAVCQGLPIITLFMKYASSLGHITAQDATLGFSIEDVAVMRTSNLISQQTRSILWDDKQDSPFRDDRRLDGWSRKRRQRRNRTTSRSLIQVYIIHRNSIYQYPIWMKYLEQGSNDHSAAICTTAPAIKLVQTHIWDLPVVHGIKSSLDQTEWMTVYQSVVS